MKILKIFIILISLCSRWTFANDKSFDHEHSAFTKLLSLTTEKKNGQTWVRYSLIKKKYLTDLRNYLSTLSRVKKTDYKNFTKNEKLAFLINAYNAFTIYWVVKSIPVKSIKDTTHFLTTPWKQDIPDYKLLGEKFTLDEIEHEKIRKNFSEPRIHFAVNCASVGCPSLRQSAYTSKNLDKELQEAEKEFFKNPNKFKVVSNQVFISPIFDWYGDDFIKKFKSIESYISVRAKTYEVAPNLSSKSLKITFLNYDWSLNGK